MVEVSAARFKRITNRLTLSYSLPTRDYCRARQEKGRALSETRPLRGNNSSVGVLLF